MLLAVAAIVLERIFIAGGAWWKAWGASCALIVFAVLFGVVGLYPNMVPSNLNPAFSITVQKAASTHLTLSIMLGVTLTFLPLILAYQGWVYKNIQRFDEKRSFSLLIPIHDFRLMVFMLP